MCENRAPKGREAYFVVAEPATKKAEEGEQT
jgi:hypothetical protein